MFIKLKRRKNLRKTKGLKIQVNKITKNKEIESFPQTQIFYIFVI